jgi:hypothetical protein
MNKMRSENMENVPIAHQCLQQFFRNEVIETAERLGNRVPPAVQLYLANLLTRFAKSDQVFSSIEGRNELEPLTLMLTRALEQDDNGRIGTLKHLGDVALYTSGLFSERIERRGVEVDYYIEMGGMAYFNVATMSSKRLRGGNFHELYSMLSEHFRHMVTLLWEFSDSLQSLNASELLAAYRQWERTGSRRLERRLIKGGLLVVRGSEICES